MSLQIKQFPIIPFSSNDSLYGSLFSSHDYMFHLIIGFLLLSFLIWSFKVLSIYSYLGLHILFVVL